MYRMTHGKTKEYQEQDNKEKMHKHTHEIIEISNKNKHE